MRKVVTVILSAIALTLTSCEGAPKKEVNLVGDCQRSVFDTYNVEVSSSNSQIVYQTIDIIKKRLDYLELNNIINFDSLSSKFTVTIYGCNNLEKIFRDCDNIYEKKFITDLIKSKGNIEFFDVSNKNWSKHFSELEYIFNTKDDSVNHNDEHKKTFMNSEKFNNPIFGENLYFTNTHDNHWIGFAKSTDTAKVNLLLKSADAKKTLPLRQVKFLWRKKSSRYYFGNDVIDGHELIIVEIPITGEPKLNGESIKLAKQGLIQMKDPVVFLTFKSEAAKIFGEWTGNKIGKSIAIVFDNQVLLAPFISNKIDGGKVQIFGNDISVEEAQKLASMLNFKALPTSVSIDK